MWKGQENMNKKRNLLIDRAIDGVSGIFMPIINVLSAAGILKGILAIIVAVGALSTDSQTYLVLNAMADSLFYFCRFCSLLLRRRSSEQIRSQQLLLQEWFCILLLRQLWKREKQFISWECRLEVSFIIQVLYR